MKYPSATGKWCRNCAGQVENVIDEDPRTMWSTQGTASAATPHEIVVDMGEALTLKGFTFLPRQDGKLNGTPDRYEFYVSVDGTTWGAPVDAVRVFQHQSEPNAANELFDQAVAGSYFRFVVLRVVDNADYVTIAEIGVITH
jgi:alpha-L-fucosidase